MKGLNPSFCGSATCSPYKRVEARSHASIHTDTAGKIGCFAAGLHHSGVSVRKLVDLVSVRR